MEKRAKKFGKKGSTLGFEISSCFVLTSIGKGEIARDFQGFSPVFQCFQSFVSEHLESGRTGGTAKRKLKTITENKKIEKEIRLFLGFSWNKTAH